MTSLKSFTVLIAIFCKITAVPVVLKESSPSGDAVVTISSNDPAVLRYLSSKFPGKSISQGTVMTQNPGQPGQVAKKSFTITGPGHASAGAAVGTGRSFVSTSAFNPFLTPMFFNPINFEGIGFGNFEPMNIFRGFESFPDPRFSGPGEVNSVSAINDNGRVSVKTVRYNTKPKKN